jgi:integrase
MADTILHQIVRDAPDLAPATKKVFLSDLDAWTAFAGDDPSRWTRARAQEFYSSLLSRMKSQSANRLMATLTYAASWWAKREQNEKLNFAVIQKAPPEETEGRSALTDGQAQALLRVASRADLPERAQLLQRPWALRDTALVVVGLETGMRRMSMQTMLIEKTGVHPKLGYEVTEVRLKGQRAPARYPVPLSESAVAALTPWLQFLAQKGIEKGAVWRRLTKRVKGVEVGKGLSAQSIFDIVVKLGGEAGIEHLTPHIFRHTFISWRLAAGWTPQQVAAVTGHQLPRTLNVANIDIGAMSHYADPKVFAPTISTATPSWLRPRK